MSKSEQRRTPNILNYVRCEALRTVVSYRTVSCVSLEHTSIIRTGNQEVMMATETIAETLGSYSQFTLHHSLMVQTEALRNVGIRSEFMPQYSLEVETEGLQNAECLF
jgi:hypothetical protein